MRLLNMDVDRYGSYGRNRLGPFSPGLNAITGPRGAGKSTLLSWLRQIAAEDSLSNGQSTGMAGSAEIENRGVCYRVTADRNGRRQVDRYSDHDRKNYSGFAAQEGELWRAANDPWSINLSEIQRRAFAGLAAADNAANQEAALEDLARRMGLMDERSTSRTHSQELLTRQADIRQRLKQIEGLAYDRAQLLARQQRLEDELHAVRGGGPVLKYEGQDVERKRLLERTAAIEADLQSAMQEAARLLVEIERKQVELERLDSDPSPVSIGESYRVQLQQIDDRLNRWRQTLRDLKSHRDRIEHSTTDARLDKQIGDQLSVSKEADPRAALRSLESQIAKTRRQLDDLVHRYTDVPGYDYRSASAAVSGTGFQAHDAPPAHGVFRDEQGRTYIGHPNHLPASSILPETLRSMQKDLHEVCQQLARHESQTATDTLRKQSSQLQRCETELLECIEELIEERGALLRRIANEHHVSVEQLTLAFGNWCQCHDHPHLKEWLLSEEGAAATQKHGGDVSSRQKLLDEIELLKQSRKNFTVRADECRRQLKDAETHRLGQVAHGTTGLHHSSHLRSEAEIQAELRAVLSDLAGISDRNRLQDELRDIERQLAGEHPTGRVDHFSEMTRKHISGLMGTTHPSSDLSVEAQQRQGIGERTAVYDLVDGVVTYGTGNSRISSPSRREVPRSIVALAMRMSIADGLSARGEPISLWIDEGLDALPVELQNSCVAYLAERAKTGQQYVLLTADQRIADCVRAYHGWSGILEQQIVREGANVNQQLAAMANEDEADKWHRPATNRSERRRMRSEFYLSESSLIEDLPSIDPDLAARCRSHGVDRIGDLLSVDPVWLAECLDVEGISQSTVEAWQTVASLLCSVRNLRPFDARVLVGAGVRGPDQLSKMHPSQLLDRVERFLATERGRRILQSGTSYELSRITTWIASATNGAQPGYDWDARYAADAKRAEDLERRHGRSLTEHDGYTNYAADDHGYDRSPRSRPTHAYPVISRSGDRRHADRESENRRSSRDSRSEARKERGAVERDYEVRGQERNGTADGRDKLKFYLELASPIVDAPSIGPRMAERLEKQGYYTVDQLLAADADELADKLNLRRVDADVVLAWQDQARLVCRIPNLRGHDAQLLIACELTSPEEIREMDAEDVHGQVSEVAESKLGQRILRGSQAPDLAEVQDWIAWAGRSRKLAA